MGHRCNYAVREHGKVTVYYSHWGALTILRDFFWGLDHATSFLAQQEPRGDDGWLDDVWGEGGAALDLDQKTLTLDDGGQLRHATRALGLEILREIWAHDGFTVRVADSFRDIATAVGLPIEVAEAEHTPRAPLDFCDDVWTGRADGLFRTLVAVDGVLRFTRETDAILELGADRLVELEGLPDHAEAYARWERTDKQDWEDTKLSLFERIDDVVIIDTAARQLVCKRSELRNGKVRRYFEAKWPGWTLASYRPEESAEIRARVGLPAQPVLEEPVPSLDAQLGELERDLFGTATDLGAWFRERSATLMATPGGWVNPDAVKPTHDGRPGDAIDANARFRAALETVLARRRA